MLLISETFDWSFVHLQLKVISRTPPHTRPASVPPMKKDELMGQGGHPDTKPGCAKTQTFNLHW